MRTKPKTKRLLIILALEIAISIASLVIVHAQGTPPSASGTAQNDDERVLLTFSAVDHTKPGDLTRRYTGIAKERDLLTGTTITIDIDCLQVVGNIAIMSGPVVTAVEGIPVGLEMLFAVVDNGEGNNANPDLFSRFRPKPKGTCDNVKVGFPDIESQRGDIQVRGQSPE